MEIIKHGQRVRHTEYSRHFTWNDVPGAGFSFGCDEQGNLLPDLPEVALGNFERCTDGTYNVTDDGIRKESWTYWDPAVGRCDCGREVVLDSSWLNTCSCGRDYDGVGTQLAPRSQWGEETGESLSDIITGYDPEEY